MTIRSRLSSILRLAFDPPHHVKVERIKGQAGALQALSLAVLGLAVLSPWFNPASRVFPGGAWLGGAAAVALFIAAQWRLSYIPEAPAKEAKDDR